MKLDHAIDKDLQIKVIGVDGKLMVEDRLIRGDVSRRLNVRDLPAAVYFVELRKGDERTVKKLLINK